ncbi:flagellar basal body-associated FliL family protein [Vibrio parahaemolyticus]|nr:flagellar basal body-associated FliL family protein [Tissierellales bacterium]MDG2774593.1 flagellar basal body-associated FliL family protein [Vibrio parahaemolyticus]NMR96776.1 flagellar basal body-associated FliL family protein [Vibrio parahaemolyticus]
MAETTKEPKKKKSKLKLIIIIVVILAVLFLAGFIYLRVANTTVGEIIESFQKEEQLTMNLDEFVVNLKSPANTRNYLKVKISIMYTDSSKTEMLMNSTSKIRDIILDNLREKEYEDVTTNEGIAKLKKEIADELNNSFGETIIKEVYITDIIVQ